MPGIGLLIDPLRTNFATNPNGEAAKIFANGGNFTTASVTAASEGVAGLTPTPTEGVKVDKSTYGGGASDSNVGNVAYTFPSAGVWTISTYCFLPSNWDGGNVQFNAEGYTGAVEVDGGMALASGKGAWQRVDVRVTVEPGDLAGFLVLRATPGFPTVGRSLYLVGLLIEKSSTLGNYFPKISQLASGYAAWTGAADNSISQLGEDVPTTIADSQLNINDGTKFRAMEVQLPTPERKITWSSSADTEGGLPANLQYENRQITLTCRVYGSSASDLQTQLGYLEQKVGKVNDDSGGTLEYTSASGESCIFDLLEGAADFVIDNAALANQRTVVTITFTAKPFWRAGMANEVAAEDHKETSLPCVIGVDPAPDGDVPALARLVIDEDQGADQWTAIWGVQCERYDSSADAALFYQAESREPQGGAATAALASASGGGNNTVLQSTLIPTMQSMMSTRASGGGNHLRNLGAYRVFARLHRPATNTGQVSACFEWSEGDFSRPNRNPVKTWAASELEGVFTMIDLGLVTISTQPWEGRLLVSSTVVGDDIYCDWLLLVPVEEGYGEIKIEPKITTPTSFSARDEFEQSAGALTGKTAPLGGVWAGAGDADDFNVGSSVVTRAVGGDSPDAGRFAISGIAAFTNQAVQVDFKSTAYSTSLKQAVLARYVDTNNYFRVYFINGAILVQRRVAGITVTLATGAGVLNLEVTFKVILQVSSSGVWIAAFYLSGSSVPLVTLKGQDAVLATGGALASGKPGFYDEAIGGSPPTRTYDNFGSWVPTVDAAVFASRSLEVHSDRVRREDSSGTVLVKPSTYRGAYFRPPPARREDRSLRAVVKLSRSNIDSMSDPAIDDASYRIYWQARGLGIPEE